MSWLSRLANVFQSSKLDRDLDDELQFHIEERIRALTANGMSRQEAEAQVFRRFGSTLRLREESRDVKLLPWLDSLLRDFRLGFRMLRKNATVTAAAVISLGLALGACDAAFLLVDALILRPLPIQTPEKLIYLSFPTYTPERPVSETFSDPVFLRLRDASREQADLFAMSTHMMLPAIFDAGGEKEQVRMQYVSGNAFELLGVKPFLGRLIIPQDDSQPFTRAAVLSHSFWKTRFGGDPSILGRSITISGSAFQVVGIAQSGFTGVEPGRTTCIWLPYASYNPRAFGNASFNWFRIFGRLKDGIPPSMVQSVLQAAFTSFRRERSGLFDPGKSPRELEQLVTAPIFVRSAANGASPLRTQFERPLSILTAIAVLVLLIAGSNVANLFLARGAAREREMALRLSIGAGRGRLIQQVLAETAIVAVAACALGLLFATVAAPSVVRMLATIGDPVELDLRPDLRLIGFAGILTLLMTALFGLTAAFRASQLSPMTTLKTGGGHHTAGTGMMRPFVVLQLAFGLMVLFVGSLLVLSFAKLSSVDPGFSASNVILMNLETTRRIEPPRERASLLNVVNQLREVPGVQSAAAAEFNALGRAWTVFVPIPGTVHDVIEATMAPVTAGFFETMRIPVVSGRTFEPMDMDTTAIVINESFARRYFRGENAVSRSLKGRFNGENDSVEPYVVVGVVVDTRYDLRQPAAPVIYAPIRTRGTIHVRAAGDPAVLMARLREDVRAAEPLFRVTTIRLQSSVVSESLLREQLLASLSTFFAAVGLALMAVGTYAVLSYSVVHRKREIGIRVALGARPLGVVRMVFVELGTAVFAAAVIGLAGGIYFSRFVERLLFQVSPTDLLSLAVPLITLLAVVTLAAVFPAIRATRVDPVVVLRCE